MKTKLFATVLCASIALPAVASAQLAPWTKRCTYDQLKSPTDAQNRRSWAQQYYGSNPYGYVSSNQKDPRFWNALMFNQIVTQNLANGIQLYPVYSDPDQFVLWKPNKLLTPNHAHTEKPAHVVNDAVCEPGCYTPQQEVLFNKGFVPIAKAQSAGLTELVTLTPDSSFDALSFFSNRVLSYTLDDKPAEQDILIFHTESGGELQVTTRHPIVAEDGSMRVAEDFRPGESLVREDGSLDPIVSIDKQRLNTQTYNLRPVTTDLLSNIVVAQGFLNGSARFQSELVDELNRVLLRKTIPSDVIPVD